MRVITLSSIACLITAVIAQTGGKPNPPTVPSDFSVTAGKPATFTWKPTTDGPVTLTLRSGAASDLNKGTVIASDIPNSGSYTFTLPADTTQNSDYTIEISTAGSNDPDSTNYSAPFVVESSNTVESATPSASASATISMTMASSASSASMISSMSSATSASSMMSSMASSSNSAASTMSTASAKSATKSSSSTSPSSSMASASSAASSGSAATGTPAAAAPSSGAGTKSVWNVRNGAAAILFGFVAAF